MIGGLIEILLCAFIGVLWCLMIFYVIKIFIELMMEK